ncbi:RHS repeat-associated core domain-containing protein [Bacteroides intestinalis]|nr:RHS repeat-associated core domain-containing protein [Bacteroides intestinalis]
MSFQYQLSHNGTSQNFFKTRTMMNEEGNKYMEVYSYYDGLGRPYQTVECKITPFQTHLITLQEYDAANRKTYTWLPVESATSTFMPSASVKAQAVADYGDTHPYTKTEYEASPLNKIVNQYGAGEDWNNHPVHIEYMTNTTSSPLNCLNYMVNDNGALVSSNQYYAAGQLYVTKSTDEDNNVGYTFTDKSGHTILTRQISGSQNLDTYYVYDGLDNLRYVLQPMYQTNANLNMYAFQYKYMGRQLCIEKKMPGAEAIKYVYDKLDRLIFSQDGNQRLQNEWTFYLYDRLNRLTVQGICMEIGRLNLIPDVAVTCYRENSNTGLGGSGYYSTFIPIDKVKEIHIVNYYDDYKFCSLTGFSGVPHFSMGSNAKGYLTGNVVTILEDGKKLYSANYYDVKGRMTKKVSSNHMNEYEVDNITYSFTDKPLTTSHTHTAINTTELYTYDYDHAERLQEVRHKLNGNSEVKLAINTYDKLGRLKTKTHHGTSGHKLTYEYNIRNWLTQISGRLFEQNLYYNTGSGSQCYNGNIGSMTWKSGEDGIRGYKFTYDNMSRMRNAIYGEGTSITPPTGKNFSENVIGYDYNGNITGLQRYGKVSGSTYGKIDDLSITYVGNQLNNVTDAATDPLYNGAFNFVDGNKTSIQEYKYDANGNLEQDYNKKIAKIQYNSLNLPSALQFANGNSTDYLYGADGMKRRVTHKTAIANISVPMGQIKELASSQISQTNTTDYCNNVIYENGVLSMILTEEGYVTLSGNAPIYHYYLKDHQGNNRIVMNQNGTTVEQVNHYYPFGGLFEEGLATSDQNYKYNSKELDRMHGLDWYDYGTRGYDATLGRFMIIDPLSERYCTISPYVYCANNPVRYIDPTGMYFDEANEKEARKIERRLTKRISKLEKKVAKIERRGEDVGELNSRISELRNSQKDVTDMRSNKNIEFKYSKVTNKNNPAGTGNPVTSLTGINDAGHNVVTMYTEKNMGNRLHESRHGGQITRGEYSFDLNGNPTTGYGIDSEVSAYKAQYSYEGKLVYIDASNTLNQQIGSAGMTPPISTLINIRSITPDFVKTRIGEVRSIIIGTNRIYRLNPIYEYLP